MDAIDLMILKNLKNGIPLVDEPYKEVAERIGVGQQEIVDRLSRMKEENILRRFAASLDQFSLGINANAVVAWEVPHDQIEKVARELVESDLFSHCYQRGIVPGVWEYNLYTVIHGRDRRSILESMDSLSQEIGVDKYGVFFSVKDLKGTGTGMGGRE